MSFLIRSSLVVLALTISAAGLGSPIVSRPFDEFGDIRCEDEMARLDNFAIQLQNAPRDRGEIIFFAGKMAGDKLPKRGEAEARAERVRSYLIKRRGVPQASLVMINGGFSSNFRIVLWNVPPEAGLVKPEDYSGVKEIQYRKGKLVPRDYRCGI